MIQLKNIEKIYPNGFCALKGINLNVARGEICSIIGYSGAGKSTLIRCINLLERPSNGEVLINGVNMLSLSEAELTKKRQKIGMIFQHFNLLSAKNVRENVAYALKIAGWQKDKITPRVDELLELVGLEKRADFRISELSGGQKQRVAIARALANSPEILLCDEATSALDPKTTKGVLKLLKKLQAELGLTVVLITHQIEVVRYLASTVHVIEGGHIVESGSASEIFAAPKHTVTKELVGAKSESVRYGEGCYRIVFTGQKANEPLISQIIKRYNIDANILSGNIDELSSGEVGHLNVKFTGQKEAINGALGYLKEAGVTLIKLGEQE
ncbi:methionine ABC transporter ATP-binding protein [Campylobacter sp. 19-13652]|uniref:methionine ABC transporter ATP-binding protein n=1 Tax=Campylobacter sp. 19-13652 TaxID=2840180 RepID=UPI001C76AB83|nr:ATP-binding cassette domain-containing protein [Campylobacter sp. 19-13652]BCX79829.1 methionine import ATP-binding protein MetN [Campylobacter sp. 19-13652]